MLKPILILFSILLLYFPAHAGEFFSDDFETGDRSTIGNDGTKWGGGNSVKVSSERSHSGNNSLRFFFEGSKDLNDDAMSEQRFEFGSNQNDFYIRYYIYLPQNYTIRDSGGANNNKFISFWEHSSGYSGPMARNMESSGTGQTHSLKYKAKIAGWPNELNCGGSVGFIPDGDSANITNDMIGSWTCIEHHIKTETENDPGAFQMWIDGELVIDNQNLTWEDGPCEPGYINRGYLMGWANSGFDEDTYIYIDDVVMSDSYIGEKDSNKETLPHPQNLSIE